MSGRERKESCDQHGHHVATCTPCVERKRRYMSRFRVVHARGGRLSAPAALTARRLRELKALGYPDRYLAAHTGISTPTIFRLLHGKVDWVQLGTFHAVERSYRELRDFPGPDKRSRNRAVKHGWTPPELLIPPAPSDERHVDPVAVERAVHGETVTLTRAEIIEAWARLETQGLSAREIGRRLGVRDRTVQRWRGEGPATREIRTA